MKVLDDQYIQKLEEVASTIQNSPQLARYIESEELDDYKTLQEIFEPKIEALYEEVATEDPLQLMAFEQMLINEVFEGLFLPRILGYSILRGEINENYKYTRPQEQFKVILKAIAHSPNFDYIKRRIGQSVQVGFALSSDIWITGLINEISNKRVRYFLKNQKIDRYRDLPGRRSGYVRYNKQFLSTNFQSAEFPQNISALKVLHSALRKFIEHTVSKGKNYKALIAPMNELINNKDFQKEEEIVPLIGLYANFFDLEEEHKDSLSKAFDKLRKEQPKFVDLYYQFLLETYNKKDVFIDSQADRRVKSILLSSTEDELSEHYKIVNEIHDKGYVNEEVMSAVKRHITGYEGLSDNTESIRQCILTYVKKVMNNLDTSEYIQFFEMNKTFAAYMQIFDNQVFSQSIKRLYMAYVKKLLKRYTDKRGKDYQEVKKFVSNNFPSLGFLKEKEVKELFKTKRKKATVKK